MIFSKTKKTKKIQYSKVMLKISGIPSSPKIIFAPLVSPSFYLFTSIPFLHVVLKSSAYVASHIMKPKEYPYIHI